MWKVGDRLVHRFNPDLGPGRVAHTEGRMVVVEFPGTGSVLRLASDSDAIRPLELPLGCRARLIETGETVIVEAFPGPDRARLADGREVGTDDLWPVDVGGSLIEQLAQGEVDAQAAFGLRLDSLHLAGARETEGLGSFLGGRIRLFPHQLYAAQRATYTDPVRWLLADEVGLGKTVEAGLILNHLLRTGRADRTLVVTPETLTVQWLGELWRKYHQVFVLVDDKRLQDVNRDYGEGFNPFDAYGRAIISLEMLRDNPYLTEQAAASGVDLLIVDEAHHLRRPPNHPGNPSYRAIQPIAATGRHLLLLTATPLEEDAHGFFRLLQLLRPEEFPEGTSFEELLEERRMLPPCTSATRRDDIGGLPPREPHPVRLDRGSGSEALLALERAARAEPAPHAVAARNKARRIRRALASGPAYEAVLPSGDAAGRALAQQAAGDDPRIAWLASRVSSWKAAGDRTLIFVAQRETLEWIKTSMSRLAQLRVGLFHEELSAGQRDIEVAQFRLPGGPSVLISTECGGEGRNFEFCTRLVLFDLPWNPMLVEQRIGRLDRIGRTRPVEIVYFRPPSGLGAAVSDLYTSLGLFERPLGGLEHELASVAGAIETLALSEDEAFDPDTSRSIVEGARQAYDRVQEAAYHELHRDPYCPEMADKILERIPQDLEELNEEVVLGACDQLGLKVDPHRDGLRYSIEIGSQSQVESLPGIAGNASFLGTFDREEALLDESIDFYASGHPLVEGILVHLEDSPLGRVGLLHVKSEHEEAFGLLAIYRDSPGFRAVAIDTQGREHPEWAERLTRRPLKTRRVRRRDWTEQPGWPQLIRGLGKHLEKHGSPLAIAALRIGP